MRLLKNNNVVRHISAPKQEDKKPEQSGIQKQLGVLEEHIKTLTNQIQKPKSWKFEIERDSNGQATTITANAQF